MFRHRFGFGRKEQVFRAVTIPIPLRTPRIQTTSRTWIRQARLRAIRRVHGGLASVDNAIRPLTTLRARTPDLRRRRLRRSTSSVRRKLSYSANCSVKPCWQSALVTTRVVCLFWSHALRIIAPTLVAPRGIHPTRRLRLQGRLFAPDRT
jgi:hypothetical protein